VNRQVPHVVGDGTFDVSFDTSCHVPHWNVDAFFLYPPKLNEL
jgi:hypothetical protein